MNEPKQKNDDPTQFQKDQLFADVYSISGRIGQGAKGTVYKAEHTLLSKSLALKIFPPDILSDADATRRFNNEAKAVANLDHDCIVKALAAGITADGIPYIATELVEGKTLEAILDEAPGFLDSDQFFRIFNQVFEALAFAHANGVVHRDLKPSNVMITDGGQAKLLDFGIAKFLGSGPQDKTATKLLVGSPAYMSPEQASGKAVDHRADIYSLGVLLFHCASGKLPFQADSDLMMMYQHQNSAPPNLVLPSGSTLHGNQLNALIQKCLAKEPADRFQSVSELQSEFNIRPPATEIKKDTSSNLPFAPKILVALAVSATLFITVLLFAFQRTPFDNAKNKLSSSGPDKTADFKPSPRLSAEQRDQRESSHRTSLGKMSLQNSDVESLIWRARNFYHSSEHSEQPAEKLELTEKSIQTYDKSLQFLSKKPDKYLLYLACVGKARALERKFQNEQALGLSNASRTEQTYRQRIELLNKAEKQVPAASYEASVIARERGESFLKLKQADLASKELNKALRLKEETAEWSPDSIKYAERDDFKEDDKPPDVLRAYQALIKMAEDRKDKAEVFKLYSRFYEMSKRIPNASEEAFMSDLVKYPVLIAQAGKKEEALEVLNQLTDQVNSEKHLGDKTADWLMLAPLFAKYGNPAKARHLLNVVEDDISRVEPSEMNERLIVNRQRAAQMKKDLFGTN